jgi:hypothetical protein
MPFDLTQSNDRKNLIKEITSYENRQRKEESFKQNEIFQDRIHPYVLDYLKGQFSQQTVSEMPVVSTINIARRIAKQEASIYKSTPEREFTDLSEEQDLTLRKIYDEMFADSKLNKSNEYFKLQKQNILQILPKEGKLRLRTLRPDQVDVVPDPTDPEKPMMYIISSMDRSYIQVTAEERQRLSNATGGSRTDRFSRSDRHDKKIADDDDWMGTQGFYTVWTPDLNFVMDHKGEIISGDDITNPIAPFLPFIDVAEDRDFEFWVRSSQSLTDFCVQFNSALSDLCMVSRSQGFAQAILSGPQDLLPESVAVGPSHVIRLPIDPNNPVETKFEFVNPSPDMQGSIQCVELLLSTYLSSRGIDPKTISGKADSQKFTSGVERLLSMIEKFEATRTDFALYDQVERKLYDLIKIWHNTIKGSGKLLPSLETSDFPIESEIAVQFAKPEMVKTDAEMLDTIERRLELGLMSRSEAIMEDRGLDDEEAAKEIIEKIEGEELGFTKPQDQGQGQGRTDFESEAPVQDTDTRK